MLINLRGLDCPTENEDKLIKWYGETHIPMLLKGGNIEKVTVFKKMGTDDNYPGVIAIYEFKDQETFQRYEESQELADAITEMQETWPTGSFESKWRVQYEAVGSWDK